MKANTLHLLSLLMAQGEEEKVKLIKCEVGKKNYHYVHNQPQKFFKYEQVLRPSLSSLVSSTALWAPSDHNYLISPFSAGKPTTSPAPLAALRIVLDVLVFYLVSTLPITPTPATKQTVWLNM